MKCPEQKEKKREEGRIPSNTAKKMGREGKGSDGRLGSEDVIKSPASRAYRLNVQVERSGLREVESFYGVDCCDRRAVQDLYLWGCPVCGVGSRERKCGRKAVVL